MWKLMFRAFSSPPFLKGYSYIYLFCYCLTICFTQSQPLLSIENNVKYSLSIQQKVQSIPEHDRIILQDFFQSLYADGDFAFTLFGNKPIAMSDHRIELTFLEASPTARKKAIIQIRGWAIWKKYRHLFPTTQFFMFGNKDQNTSFSIRLVAKKQCLKSIQGHLALFQEIFGPKKTEDIFDEIIHQWIVHNVFDNPTFPEHYFQCLGILLGYGKSNAEAFEKRSMNYDILALAPIDLIKQEADEQLTRHIHLNINNIHLPDKTYDVQVSELIKKIHILKENYGYTQATYECNPLFMIRVPGFMSLKNNPETEVIKTSYDSLRKELVDIFYSDKFLEIILSKLTASD
jgi:hypothetical protein